MSRGCLTTRSDGLLKLASENSSQLSKKFEHFQQILIIKHSYDLICSYWNSLNMNKGNFMIAEGFEYLLLLECSSQYVLDKCSHDYEKYSTMDK